MTFSRLITVAALALAALSVSASADPVKEYSLAEKAAICGEIAPDDTNLGGRVWSRLAGAPDDARDLRQAMTGDPEIYGFYDEEFWFVSDQGDTRLCRLSSFIRTNCPQIYESCKLDYAIDADGQTYSIGDHERICMCHERRRRK